MILRARKVETLPAAGDENGDLHIVTRLSGVSSKHQTKVKSQMIKVECWHLGSPGFTCQKRGEGEEGRGAACSEGKHWKREQRLSCTWLKL